MADGAQIVESVQDIEVPGNGRAGIWAQIRSFRVWPSSQKYLVALLILFAAKQTLNVVIFPPFTGHDEVAHYAYLRTVADEHRVPVIPDLAQWRAAWQARTDQPGDYIPDDLYKYQRYVLDWCCNPDASPAWASSPPPAMSLNGKIYPNGWQYAANHPPLYYLLMTPVYAATDHLTPGTQQYLLRAAVIPIGMAIIVLTYLMAGLLFPGDRLVMSVAPTFVAFQTQVSYESAMINNDILLVGMFTLLTWLLIRGIKEKFTFGSAAVIGLVLGLGLLTKASMLTAVPLIAIAMVLGVGVRNYRRWLPMGSIAALVAALVSWPWYLFLHRTYGNFSALDQVKALQYRWTYGDNGGPSIWEQLSDKGFAQLRWRETWGEFGWRLIQLSSWLLVAIGIPLLVMTVAGLAILIAGSVQRLRPSTESDRMLSLEQCVGLWLLVILAIVAYGAMLQFGTEFSLTQARYYFNAVGAVAIILAFGLKVLTPPRFQSSIVVVFLVCMVLANVMIYTQSVVPYWYLPT